MKINDQIKALNTSLKDALINGEYEFIEGGLHTCVIKIAGVQFEMWTGSNPETNFAFWNHGDLLSGVFTCDEDRKAAFNVLSPFIDNHRKTVLKAKKLEELEALKKELESFA